MTTYRLDRIVDLTQIPPDRLGACMRELEYAIAAYHVAKHSGLVVDVLGPLEWTDDNKLDCSFVDPESGRQVNFKITP